MAETISGNIVDLRILIRLVKFARPYIGRFYFLIFLTISVAIVAPLRPYLIQITIDDYGIGAFVAAHVRNDGVIVANMGKVSLASASGFAIDLYGDSLISFLVENPNEYEIVHVATQKGPANTGPQDG